MLSVVRRRGMPVLISPNTTIGELKKVHPGKSMKFIHVRVTSQSKMGQNTKVK